MLDIYYFKKLFYFYFTLPLLLIPLVIQYMKYMCFKDYKELIAVLENNLEVIDDYTKSISENLIPKLTIKEYLDKIIIYHISNQPNPFIGKIGLSLFYFNNRTPQERSKNLDYKKITEYYIWCLNWVEKIHIIYTLLIKYEKILDILTNLLLYACYFIGWSYVLFHSKADVFIIIQLFIYPIDENPFI